MKKSPIQFNKLPPEMKKLFVEAQLGNNLIKAYESLGLSVEEAKQMLERAANASVAAANQLSRVYSLPKGDKGDRGFPGPRGIEGKPGKTPVKGEDYLTDEEIEEFTLRILARIRKPEDGKSPIFDEAAVVAKLVESFREEIKNDKKFNWRMIPGLENEISSYRNQLAGKRYGKDTWARGGGMTMSAGTNIVLTPQADGTVRIDALGSSGGITVVPQYSLTAVQSGSDVTIDLSQLTNYATFSELIQIQRNNVPQTETINFTFADPTVTIFNADAGEVFNAIYSYT